MWDYKSRIRAVRIANPHQRDEGVGGGRTYYNINFQYNLP